VVLTTGRRSERFAQLRWPKLTEEAFIQIGDFFKMSLEAAADRGFNRITLAVFFGKAVKMAQGIPHTHAAKFNQTLNKLSEWALQATRNRKFSDHILAANTARQAFEIIRTHYPAVISEVGKRIIKSAKLYKCENIKIQCVIFDYYGKVVFDSEKP
jgi:cobalt-precorrin-5B (C1)-methyltransferase